MKTFKLIGMSLIVVMMGTGLAACNEDDENGGGDKTPVTNENGIVTNQKKLKKISFVEEDDAETMEFIYNAQGQLSSVHYYDLDDPDDIDITNVTWGNNAIISSNVDDDDETTTYTLSEGLVRSYKEKFENRGELSATFEYNSNKQVTQIKSVETYSGYSYPEVSQLFTWDANRLTKYTEGDWDNGTFSGEDYIYTYSGKTCKGYSPNWDEEMWEHLDDVGVSFAHPELFGVRRTELPDKCYIKKERKSSSYDYAVQEECHTTYTDETTLEFAYTFTNDGYVSGCTVVDNYVYTTTKSFEDKNGDNFISNDERNVTTTYKETDTTIYTYTWE